MVNQPAVTKPLGLVLIVTAHMVFNGPCQEAKNGILGGNITLEFIFNATDTKINSFGIYTGNLTQMVYYNQGKINSGYPDFNVYLENTTLFFQITNLKLNHSGCYWASAFEDSGTRDSTKVQLFVREENRSSSTDPPMPDNSTVNNNSETSSLFSPHIVSVLVVSPVVLLAAVLPLLIWSLVRTKDKQQQQPPPPPRLSSNLTVQETVAPSNSVPEPPLVYSVLDFPKRPSAVLEMNSSDTEYAAVSYHTEKRQG